MKNEVIKTLEIWIQVFKRAWPWVVFYAAFELLSAYLEGLVPKEETFLFISVMLLLFGLGLIVTTVGVIIVNQVAYDYETKSERSLPESLGKNFKQSMIESLRALAPITLRFLLLLVPGIIETIRLYWIIYIVQFDEGYQTGQVDALERSRALVNGRFWKTASVLLFVLGLGMFPLAMGNERDYFGEPIILAGLIFLNVALGVLGDAILYRFYMRVKNGIEIQKSGYSVP